MSENLYEILGVSEDATREEIKAAFRSLAQKYHPDKAPGNESAAKKFQAIQKAYSVLSNPKLRENYDAAGATNVPPSEETKIRDLVISLFVEALKKYDPSRVNILDKMVLKVESEMDIMRMKRSEAEKVIEKIRPMLEGRMKAKDESKSVDIFIGAVEAEIDTLRRVISAIDSDIDMGNKVIEFLDQYEDVFEVVAQLPHTQSGTSNDGFMFFT